MYCNDDCEECEGRGYIEATYSEARVNPGGSNDRALRMAGEVAKVERCHECDGTGRGRCHRCGDEPQEPGERL